MRPNILWYMSYRRIVHDEEWVTTSEIAEDMDLPIGNASASVGVLHDRGFLTRRLLSRDEAPSQFGPLPYAYKLSFPAKGEPGKPADWVKRTKDVYGP